ncbi:LrgB family protein [Clostridium septicum]|uniref:LrgB family protein n=1 Tax=Clostridium septicum TaxID=1504 RepID=A0A9N7JME1_CLOSE|nr:LrgB family protein [Clostridium septicum]AYE35413.1 LrgB family protein [Clostridium septicum]MDU1314386.1 LrgB family protein [Clostridium septicum]QAS60801.1 LrgB family protein [Clostridium septicum]UEC19935.1 LrgB family protein [Clostridium septicum]USS02005.1 LrgB family protein [Clostridium septicum]
MNILTSNILFGIVLSLLSFEIGLLIYKKTKMPIFNPLLIAIAIIIAVLVIFNIDFNSYNNGGQFINMFLGPATVVLAVPLYKQFHLLKENFVPIIIGIFVGCLVGIFSVIALCISFGIENVLTKSLLAKSVTTPIGIEITNQLGGLVPVTVLAIILSGIIGAVAGPTLCKLFKIKNELAIGIAIGTASHAVGTTKALELGETQGAMSSLSIGIAGIMTVFLAPICFKLITLFLS